MVLVVALVLVRPKWLSRSWKFSYVGDVVANALQIFVV